MSQVSESLQCILSIPSGRFPPILAVTCQFLFHRSSQFGFRCLWHPHSAASSTNHTISSAKKQKFAEAHGPPPSSNKHLIYFPPFLPFLPFLPLTLSPSFPSPSFSFSSSSPFLTFHFPWGIIKPRVDIFLGKTPPFPPNLEVVRVDSIASRVITFAFRDGSARRTDVLPS